MDHYSILDPRFSEVNLSSPPPHGGWEPQHQQQPPAEELRFPGEDGGQSLAEWARRDLEATLQLLADRAQYITGASGAAIALRDGEHIVCRASSGSCAPEIGSFLQVNSGLSGESVRTRRIRRCDNAETDPRVNRESCRGLGIASFAVLPLIRNNEVIGIFEIFSGKPHSFEERDINALERMGEMVNTALDQVQHARPKVVLAGLEVREIRVQTAAPDQADFPAELKPLADSNSAVEPESQIVRQASAMIQNELSAEIKHFEAPVDELVEPTVPGDEAAAGIAPVISRSRRDGTVLGTQLALGPICTCSTCGFPVSAGRTLCLDCEAAAAEEQFTDEAAPQAPAFLADLDPGESQPGFKTWFLSHKYLVGTFVVVASAVAMLLLR